MYKYIKCFGRKHCAPTETLVIKADLVLYQIVCLHLKYSIASMKIIPQGLVINILLLSEILITEARAHSQAKPEQEKAI